MKKYIPKDDPKSKPTITFNSRGQISINGPACEALGLKTGDKVAFYQNDAARPQDWFVGKCDKGMLLKRYSKRRGLVGNWQYICRQLRKSIGFYGSTASIPVVADADDNGLHALITSAVKDTGRVLTE
ncbi:hypothetical protein [Millionella massiliensis]|uniref:hypothetical protein n=1 Tax=Millionella massiliensis TaxID=1871023 RepID=UPI0024B73103|nr:hypothetical protein [Millionella massiliensis]